MHLIETYATNCGLKIDSPFVYEKYINLPDSKYIIFHPHSKPSKTYSFWQDVLDLIIPILSNHGIYVLQIGAKGEKVYNGVLSYVGETDINQVAFLIARAEGILCVDTFSAHFASYFNKPIVALYSNNNINNVRPFWGDKNKQVLLEPKRENGEKPSYSLEENPKSINKIKPEVIAKHLIKSLNLPELVFNFETVEVGGLYENKILEMIPTQPVNLQPLNVDSIIVRMDQVFNEQVLEEQLKIGKCVIVTNKPININLLTYYRNRINQLIYLIEKDNSPDFISQVYTSGVNYFLLTFLPEEQLNSIKLDYLDYGVILIKNNKKPDILNNGKEVFYKNGKFTLCSGKIFPSIEAWKLNRPVPNFATVLCSTKDYNDEFWREQDHHMFLLKND